MKLTYLLFLVSLLVSAEASAFDVLFRADELDRRENIAVAQANPFDRLDGDEFDDFDKFNCIDLEDYNRFAELNPYDRFDELNAKNVKRKDLKRMRRDDYNKIANENPNDKIRPDGFDYADMGCFKLKDYNAFAQTNKGDRFDPVYFNDFDDLKTVQKVGRSRFNFFETQDLARFDLQNTRLLYPYHPLTQPEPFVYYHYPPYGYVKNHQLNR